MSTNHLPEQVRKQLDCDLDAWQRQSSTSPDDAAGTIAWIDWLCPETDRLVALCNHHVKPPVTAQPLLDFKEMVLAFYRLPADDPERPTQGKLNKALWGANAAAAQIRQQLVSCSQTRQASAKRHRVTREEANKAMMKAVQEVPDRMKWSVREWAQHVVCSTYTIHKTEMWRRCQLAREKAKQERTAPRGGRRRPRHYPD